MELVSKSRYLGEKKVQMEQMVKDWDVEKATKAYFLGTFSKHNFQKPVSSSLRWKMVVMMVHEIKFGKVHGLIKTFEYLTKNVQISLAEM